VSEKEEIVADREIEIPGMEDVAIEPETNVVVMNPDNNQNEVGRQKELTDGVRKQQIDLEGIGTSEIHNLSDTNVARVGESRTDITDKSEFVETRETEPVDKAGWIVRRISELGGYENVSDYVKTDVFGFDIADISGSIRLFSDVIKKLGIKLMSFMRSSREFMMRVLIEMLIRRRLEIRFGTMAEEGDSSVITSCRKVLF